RKSGESVMLSRADGNGGEAGGAEVGGGVVVAGVGGVVVVVVGDGIVVVGAGVVVAGAGGVVAVPAICTGSSPGADSSGILYFFAMMAFTCFCTSARSCALGCAF